MPALKQGNQKRKRNAGSINTEPRDKFFFEQRGCYQHPTESQGGENAKSHLA